MADKIIRWAKLIYSSLPRVRGLAKKVSASRAYYKIVRAGIESRVRTSGKGPFNLVLETSNFCPARCLMCPHSSMKRQKGVMNDEVFSKIIERVKQESLPINKVFFSGLGEPLTDPQIIPRIKAFKEMGFSVKLYSNAFLLTSAISQQLVDLQIEEINISFNGASPEDYQEIMGLDFDKTKASIENLIKIRKEKKSSLPKILISSVLTKDNKDINQHIKNWSKKVDSVTISIAHEWGGGVQLNSKFPAKGGSASGGNVQGSKLTYPCRSLWHTFMVDWEGNFVICCRDFESKFVLGNILTHSFSETWKSPILESFRQTHLNFSEEKLPAICRQCNFPFQDGIEWFVPRSLD
ncbi:MAG: SPASM domain-containing protein [bacterium]|nr:SPASM domain-containing protein [bacterium]